MESMLRFFLIFLFFSLFLWAIPQEIFVDLKDPEYQGGVMSTHVGGIITSETLRIQARHIIYTNKINKGEKIHQVIAEDRR